MYVRDDFRRSDRVTRVAATIRRLATLGAGLLLSAAVGAQNLFSHGFEDRQVDPLFPQVNGVFQLPSGPTTNQLQWILDQLAAPDTSIAEINAHFDPAWLASISAADTRDFIATVRAQFPDAVVTDVVTVTPVRVTVVIESPGGSNPAGFLQLGARFSGSQLITLFGVSNYFGSVQFPADQTLNLTEAADKFETLGAQTSLLVASIDPNGQCVASLDRNAAQARATGSIFKIWVLAAVAEGVAAGTVTLDQSVALVAAELALAGVINIEPLGTLFSVLELGTLMMGISDNTATDLLHELIGRDPIEQVVVDSGVADPDALTPFLSVNEQFHLFFSFALATAQSYVSGTEMFQQDFLDNQIVPLGPLTSFPFNNESLFIDGSWRASPLDVCAAFAAMRDLPNGSDALELVNRSLGASTAQPGVRNFWGRVWYKGGSLESGVNGLLVLTHAWMLESMGADPQVVVAMVNEPAGGIDVFDVQSVTGRILQLVREGQ